MLSPQKLTRIPLAPSWVAGVLNLRGRIVTAINLRERMGFPPRDDGGEDMSVVLEFRGEPYSLQIDEVGDVLRLEDDRLERNPVTLDQRWRELSKGIYRLDDELLVALDVEKLLDFDQQTVVAA